MSHFSYVRTGIAVILAVSIAGNAFGTDVHSLVASAKDAIKHANVEGAKQYYKAACALNDKTSCAALDLLIGNFSEAKSLSVDGCAKGNEDACRTKDVADLSLGNYAAIVPGTTRRCSNGDMQSCMIAGMANYKMGNFAAAVTLVKKACDAGLQTACKNLSHFQSANSVGKENATTASDIGVLDTKNTFQPKAPSAKVVPYLEDGAVIGYKFKQIQDGTAFQKVGLKVGDVLIYLNGTLVRTAQASFDAAHAIENLTFTDLTVDRDGRRLLLKCPKKSQ